jgi:hypothetical protein
LKSAPVGEKDSRGSQSRTRPGWTPPFASSQVPRD